MNQNHIWDDWHEHYDANVFMQKCKNCGSFKITYKNYSRFINDEYNIDYVTSKSNEFPRIGAFYKLEKNWPSCNEIIMMDILK